MAMFLGSLFSHALKKHPRVTMVVLFLTLSIGFVNTFLRVFSPRDRDFFLRPVAKPSRYMIAEEERKVAEIAAKERLSLYVYNWQFYPTLIYYSSINGGVNIAKAEKDLTLTSPFLLLIPVPLFKGLDALPIHMGTNSTAVILMKGEAANLVKVTQ